MKTTIMMYAACAAVTTMACAAHGQTNFVRQVADLWFAGHKTNVLAIAGQRLQQNTNDIAGLILQMEYETEFLLFDQMSNTINRVVQVGATITTPKFSALYPLVTEEAEYWKKVASTYHPPAQLAEDRAKGNIAGKPLAAEFLLEALREDGYFQ
jgi:hypothetical protein